MSILVVALKAESSAGAWPYVIGGGILLLFLAALLTLLVIGAGREHS